MTESESIILQLKCVIAKSGRETFLRAADQYAKALDRIENQDCSQKVAFKMFGMIAPVLPINITFSLHDYWITKKYIYHKESRADNSLRVWRKIFEGNPRKSSLIHLNYLKYKVYTYKDVLDKFISHQ